MKSRFAPLAAVLALSMSFLASGSDMVRPRAGKVEIFHVADIKPGMKATAWTVFAGGEPEPVPIEIVGLMKNAWGPKQDIIVGKMGGKAIRTNVAGGMSGSPVYIDGKLVGAVALRLSTFSPDSICGITPIELMLEINDFDKSSPADAKAPGKAQTRASVEAPGWLLGQAVSAGGAARFAAANQFMIPIDTPLTFSGFTDRTLSEFGPMFQQAGLAVVQGGASGSLNSPKPAAGWRESLQPGEAVAGVLVSGDMSVTGLGTVTYNDGKRVLAFGHSFFNLGPVDMPMSKAEILMTLASQYQPNKFGNATEIVGALKQDRHSGIMGELGAASGMIPVDLKVRTYSDGDKVLKEKNLHFNVFVNQKWTPYLMMVTLFNSLEGLNDFADESTYRLSGKVELDGMPGLSLSTMAAPSEMPTPAPMLLANWWGDKFNRLFLNSVETPKLKRVNATVDLLPARRIATIENAWIPNAEVDAGATVAVKVFLRPYRGERIERQFDVKLPAGLSKGDHRILLSDADTLNRMQSVAGLMSRYMDIPQTVSLINQERANNRLYVSLIDPRPTVYSDDKTLPSLPPSVLNVMQTGRAASRHMMSSPESAVEQMSLPFEQVISGSYSLRITVK
ncbi:MAG: hypothetical protein JSU00_15230 [Acidobacteria bacterium]|nr:hypothetical protein [Acidobacteriota bacterium]